jgi:hypothetical protein
LWNNDDISLISEQSERHRVQRTHHLPEGQRHVRSTHHLPVRASIMCAALIVVSQTKKAG